MTLFVGGTKHGTTDTGAMVDEDEQPSAASIVDPLTGETYVRVPVSFQLNNPLTNQPIPGQVWSNDIYLASHLAGDPQQGMAALGDAVTRWWFVTHGTQAVSTVDVEAQMNGHHKPGETLTANCEECLEGPIEFDTRKERAAWMQHHIDTTGHKVVWADDPAVPIIKESE